MPLSIAKTRFVVGLCLLLVTDVIWACLSLYTSWMVHQYNYSKPFFLVYCSFSTLTLYLLGFVCCRPWRKLCRGRRRSSRWQPADLPSENEVSKETSGSDGSVVDEDEASYKIEDMVDNATEFEYVTGPPPLYQMSTSEFEPMKRTSSMSDSDKSVSSECSTPRPSRVRFSNVKEVRILPHEEAEEAGNARRSFDSSHVVMQRLLKHKKKLTFRQVIFLSLILSCIWVPGEYLLALVSTKTFMWTVQICMSISGLWVMLFSGIFPSDVNDYITLTKSVVVCTSIAGGVLVGLSVKSDKNGAFMTAAMPSSSIVPWAVATVIASILLCVFIVVLKKRAHSLFRIDVTMFLGFTGLWCLIFGWPGILIFNFVGDETFSLPDESHVWLWLFAQATLGMAVGSLLWIWGSFLTSPLVGVLSLLLLGPFIVSWNTALSIGSVDSLWMLCGCILLFLSFVAICLLHWNKNPDPMLLCVKSLINGCATVSLLAVNSEVNETTHLISNECRT